MMIMMMPPAMPHPAMPHPVPMMQVMHPQMIAGGSPTAGAAGAPPVMMMPMQHMAQMAQMAAPGGVRAVEGGMVPEPAGPMVMPLTLPNDMMNQYEGRRCGMPDTCEPAGAAYPTTPQCYTPNAAPSPSFQSLCSPTYQSSDAYEQYVRDIMNADGDDFDFGDMPRKSLHTPQQGSAQAMMAAKNRMPSCDVSTDAGTWSYASERSASMVMSP